MDGLLLLVILGVAMQSDVEPEAVLRTSPAIFDCGPSRVSDGQQIRFTKGLRELDELLVLTPYGETGHFLVVDAPPPEMRPLMTTEELAQAASFSIEVVSLEGLEWKRDSKPERVFREPGEYQFWISTTLESEDPTYKCIVEYVP